MNILSLCLMALLTPNGDMKQAGVWAHYQDTLIVMNSGYYYSNADAITYMCGPHGEAQGKGYLKGSCLSSGAPMILRNDTLFIVTTGELWTPYMRVPLSDLIAPTPKPDTIKTSSFGDWTR